MFEQPNFMGSVMSDHQDSEAFTYERTWAEIERMLDAAERKMNFHHTKYLEYQESGDRKKTVFHARNYKALQGVVKTLRWTLGDKEVSHPLD